MTTEYKLNTYIEWTDEDRAKGECPVPEGSDVTFWLRRVGPSRVKAVTAHEWRNSHQHITAYLIHSVPREPIMRWVVIGGTNDGLCHPTEALARLDVAAYGGRVVKLVEEV